MFLTCATLCREGARAALINSLVPQDRELRANIGHRLMWTLFADHPDRRRDFLWREVSDGIFMLLSEREPQDSTGLLMFDPPQPFSPCLRRGDPLRFMLRVNATVRDKARLGSDRRVGILYAAMAAVPPKDRARLRQRVTTETANRWLDGVGRQAGFERSGNVTIDADARQQIVRPGFPSPINVDVLDLTGVLTVTEPERFVPALAEGFGRAKAFGYGLMLVRRA